MKIKPEVATILGVVLMGMVSSKKKKGSRSKQPIPQQKTPVSQHNPLPTYRYWGDFELEYPSLDWSDGDHEAVDPHDIDVGEEYWNMDDQEKRLLATQYGIDRELMDKFDIRGKWPSIQRILSHIQDTHYNLETEVREMGWWDIAQDDEWFLAQMVENLVDDEQIKIILAQTNIVDPQEVQERVQDQGKSEEEVRYQIAEEEMGELTAMIRRNELGMDSLPNDLFDAEDIINHYGVWTVLVGDDCDGFRKKQLIQDYQNIEGLDGSPFHFDIYSIKGDLGEEDIQRLLFMFISEEYVGSVEDVTFTGIGPWPPTESEGEKGIKSKRQVALRRR